MSLVHMHTSEKNNGDLFLLGRFSAHPQAAELLTTPEEPIASMAICGVPEVGRDECMLCSSHSSLNEASALVWVGKGASREATASQVSINHLLPLPFSTINPELWQKKAFCDYSWYLMSAAWAWIHFCWSSLSPEGRIYLIVQKIRSSYAWLGGGVWLGIWRLPTAWRSKSISFAWEDHFC